MKKNEYHLSRLLRTEVLETRNLLSAMPLTPDLAQEEPAAYFSFDSDEMAGTLTGGVLVEKGANDGALQLDGVDDYFCLTEIENLNIQGEITLAAWIKPESVSGIQDILAKGYTRNPNAEVFLRINNGQYQVGSWNGTEHFASYDIPESDVGEWVYLCGTYDGAQWHLYRNGEEVASVNSSVGAVAVESEWSIGANGNGTERFFDGKIKEVELYDTAIIPDQIAARYAAPTVIPAESTAAKVSFGGKTSANMGMAYTLYLYANHYPNVTFHINWGDETESSDSVENATEISHVYKDEGEYTISVTAFENRGKDNQREISIYGGNQQTVSVRETFIRNGDFTELTPEQRQNVTQYGWWLGEIAGWSGEVEIRDGFVELDSDQNQPPDKTQLYSGNQTSITSDSINMYNGKPYSLSFDTANRSEYAGDNLVKVTVPGEILYVNNITVEEFLALKAAETARVGVDPAQNQYGFITLNSDNITYSAGGCRYANWNRTSGDDPIFIDTQAGIKITSIVFRAASDSGSVIFEDDSIDYVSSYGPYLYSVDIAPRPLDVDLNADYENQGNYDSGWKYRNNRIEDMEGFPGYVIPMVPESDSSLQDSPYTLSLDCSQIDPLFRSAMRIRVSADNEGVLDFAPIDMALNEYIDDNGEQSSIAISALPGTENKTVNVTVEIYKPSDGTSEEVVMVSDTVKVTTTVFIMGDHTNYGQLCTPDLDTRFMWECDLANNTYKTPKSEGKKYLNGKEDANGRGDSYLESALTYSNGFTMDYRYDFLRGDGYGDEYGYTCASGSNDKLSFVGNGGIKYGSTAGASKGVFEVALLDMEAMLNKMGYSLSDTNLLEELVLNTDGKLAVNGFTPETPSTLMHGVGYGQDYSMFFPGMTVIGERTPLKLLEACFANFCASGNMTIVADAVTPESYGAIQVITNDILTFDSAQGADGSLPRPTKDNKENPIGVDSKNKPVYEQIDDFNGKIYLQAHWGSGVVYGNVTLDQNL